MYMPEEVMNRLYRDVATDSYNEDESDNSNTISSEALRIKNEMEERELRLEHMSESLTNTNESSSLNKSNINENKTQTVTHHDHHDPNRIYRIQQIREQKKVGYKFKSEALSDLVKGFDNDKQSCNKSGRDLSLTLAKSDILKGTFSGSEFVEQILAKEVSTTIDNSSSKSLSQPADTKIQTDKIHRLQQIFNVNSNDIGQQITSNNYTNAKSLNLKFESQSELNKANYNINIVKDLDQDQSNLDSKDIDQKFVNQGQNFYPLNQNFQHQQQELESDQVSQTETPQFGQLMSSADRSVSTTLTPQVTVVKVKTKTVDKKSKFSPEHNTSDLDKILKDFNKEQFGGNLNSNSNNNESDSDVIQNQILDKQYDQYPDIQIDNGQDVHPQYELQNHLFNGITNTLPQVAQHPDNDFNLDTAAVHNHSNLNLALKGPQYADSDTKSTISKVMPKSILKKTAEPYQRLQIQSKDSLNENSNTMSDIGMIIPVGYQQILQGIYGQNWLIILYSINQYLSQDDKNSQQSQQNQNFNQLECIDINRLVLECSKKDCDPVTSLMKATSRKRSPNFNLDQVNKSNDYSKYKDVTLELNQTQSQSLCTDHKQNEKILNRSITAEVRKQPMTTLFRTWINRSSTAVLLNDGPDATPRQISGSTKTTPTSESDGDTNRVTKVSKFIDVYEKSELYVRKKYNYRRGMEKKWKHKIEKQDFMINTLKRYFGNTNDTRLRLNFQDFKSDDPASPNSTTVTNLDSSSFNSDRDISSQSDNDSVSSTELSKLCCQVSNFDSFLIQQSSSSHSAQNHNLHYSNSYPNLTQGQNRMDLSNQSMYLTTATQSSVPHNNLNSNSTLFNNTVTNLNSVSDSNIAERLRLESDLEFQKVIEKFHSRLRKRQRMVRRKEEREKQQLQQVRKEETQREKQQLQQVRKEEREEQQLQ